MEAYQYIGQQLCTKHRFLYGLLALIGLKSICYDKAKMHMTLKLKRIFLTKRHNQQKSKPDECLVHQNTKYNLDETILCQLGL